MTATITHRSANEEVLEEAGEKRGEATRLESSRADLASRIYFIVSGLYFLATCVAGLLWAASVMSPAVVGLAEANARVAPHGNLLPVLWNVAVYGWLSSACFGAITYIVPRLTGSPLRLGELLALNALAWAGLVGLGALAVSAGFGRTLWLLEYPAPLQVAMAASALLVLGVVLFSVLGRIEARIYPSLWYFAASLIWLSAALVVGALPLYAGLGQGMQGAFVAQVVIGLWLATAATGVAYYVVPKEAGSPLYSRKLAQLSLWGFAIFWALAGGVRHVFSPTSGAYQSASIAFAISASVPLLATVANLTKSLEGMWARVTASSVLRWMASGIAFLVVYAVLLPFSVLRSVNQITGLTGSAFGVDRVLLFGVAGSWLIGSIYYAMPRVTGRRWAYTRMIQWQLGLFATGILVVATAEIVGGAVQGFLANSSAAQAFPVTFGDAWQTIAGPQRWFSGMATLGWAVLVLCAALGVINGARTLIGGEPGFVETVTLPEELAGIRPQAEIVSEEARRRLIEPIALPVVSALTVVVVVYFASRILLAVQRYGSKAQATAVALLVAAIILGVSSLLAIARRLRSQVLGAVMIVGLLAVVAGGAFAQSRLKAADETSVEGQVSGSVVNIALVAQNIAFDKSTLEASAGSTVSVAFENKDPVEHNFALYADEQMQKPIFQGALIGTGTTTYTFTAPSEPGTYYFFCDIHPTMKGIFTNY